MKLNFKNGKVYVPRERSMWIMFRTNEPTEQPHQITIDDNDRMLYNALTDRLYKNNGAYFIANASMYVDKFDPLVDANEKAQWKKLQQECALRAMQGILSQPELEISYEELAEKSLETAKAMIHRMMLDEYFTDTNIEKK